MPPITSHLPFPWATPTIWESAGQVISGATTGTALTAGAANTKGSWVELIASTANKTVYLIVWARRSAGTPGLIDIGIGAAASEVVLIPNISPESAGDGFVFEGPIRIAAGTRIAARYQNSTASDTGAIAIYLGEVVA